MDNATRQESDFGFKNYMKSNPRAWGVLVLWVLVTAAVVLSLLYLRLAENERNFHDKASHAYSVIDEKISINETVLEGFASMLRLIAKDKSDQVRQFTSEMRSAYPHIYMLEVQTYVLEHERSEFEQYQREQGLSEYQIKKFDYDDRAWEDLNTQRAYYPIHFVDPMGTDADAVLGLDMLSVPFLHDALVSATRSGRSTATEPFTLVEGGRAYVLFKALKANPDFEPYGDNASGSTVVSLLIKTNQLLRYASQDMPQASATLIYHDTENGEITEVIEASQEQKYVMPLGSLVFQRQLDDFGQPFQLILQADNGLSGWDIVLALALLSLSAFVGWFYFQNTYRRYLSNLGREKALQDLAKEREGLEQRVEEQTEELSQKTEEIRQLAGKLVNLKEDDYRYIARELHDEFGQLITAIGINTKLVSNRISDDSDARELSGETQGLVDQLHTSMHSLIGRLRPEALDTFGLKISIEHCIDLFKLDKFGIECHLALDPQIDDLPDNYAITIYRSVQELVNNSVRHGKPKLIEVNVMFYRAEVVIQVNDDGCGMDVKNPPNGYGLFGLSERLLALNGTIDIASSPNGGCCVEVRLPLEADYRGQVGV